MKSNGAPTPVAPTLHMSMPTTMVKAAELEHYRRHGFVRLRNVIPTRVLNEAQSIMEPWVDFFIEKWGGEGLLRPREVGTLDFPHRFLEAWTQAGRPHFRRSPYRFLVNERMYEFLLSRVFLELAEQILGTKELSVHGVFNGRPQLPHHTATLTPWHQDAQYWNRGFADVEEPDRAGKTHVLTMWIPLQNVDERSGCLKVISREGIGDRLFDAHDYDYQNTGFLGLAPDVASIHRAIPVPMELGDVLLFDQLTPHAAMANERDRVRWSVDVRFEATATATVVGRKFGFVAQSQLDPGTVTPPWEWVQKRAR